MCTVSVLSAWVCSDQLCFNQVHLFLGVFGLLGPTVL